MKQEHIDPDRPLVIAIDGPAGAGKSTAAKRLANALSYIYLDTGALYRGVAWKVIEERIDLEDVGAITRLCHSIEIELILVEGQNEVWIDGVNVTPYLRVPKFARASSTISQIPAVREKLLSIQQTLGRAGGIVAEGRDIGTVVFPNADLKFFLDASIDVRGARRFEDHQKNGITIDLKATTQNLKTRDHEDRSRPISPLQCGDDAILIDSSDLNADEVFDRMMQAVTELNLQASG